METKIVTKTQVDEVAACLLQNQVVALPTETVMGLAAVYDQESAFLALMKAKNRPQEKAFPIVVGRKEQVNEIAYVSPKQQQVMDAFFPGPLTIILKKKETVAPFMESNGNTVAIRMSEDAFLLAVLAKVNKPLFLTSANKAGDPAALNHERAYAIFNGEIPLVVEGSCVYNVASTIVDLTKSEPVILRQGVITLEQIKKVLGGKI